MNIQFSIAVAILMLGAGLLIDWIVTRLRDRYRVFRNEDSSIDESVQRLIKDVREAHRGVLIMCGRCKADRATPEVRDALLKAIRERTVKAPAGKGILIQLVVHGDIPQYLADLKTEGAIQIEAVGERSAAAFRGRIIDGRVLERHLNSDESDGVASRGVWIRSDNAWPLALEIVDSFVPSLLPSFYKMTSRGVRALLPSRPYGPVASDPPNAGA